MNTPDCCKFDLLLSRCNHCGVQNPDPELAFCSDRCAEAWQGDTEQMLDALADDVAHLDGMHDAWHAARATGLWN